MQGRATRIVAGALAALAVVSLAGPARASEIQSRYRITSVGDYPGVATRLGIDEEGNLGGFFNTPAGDYNLGRIPDPSDPSRTLEVLLLKSGSGSNLLPEPLRSPLKVMIRDFNASGGVVGSYNVIDGGSFYYDVETQELVDLKRLPGAVHSVRVSGINDLNQIVGEQDGKAILFASPEAVPVELTGLLEGASGWGLTSATGINNRGEIVGYGGRSVRDGGYYGPGFYKLEPTAVPEPSSVVVFAALGLLGAGSAALGRRRRAGRAST